jgi:hypothetical protein
MDPGSNGSWKGNWTQKSQQTSKTDGPYAVACDRETTAPFPVDTDSYLSGTPDTGCGTHSSSLWTVGKAPNALQAWPCTSSRTRQKEPTEFGVPFFLFWRTVASTVMPVHRCHCLPFTFVTMQFTQSSSIPIASNPIWWQHRKTCKRYLLQMRKWRSSNLTKVMC